MTATTLEGAVIGLEVGAAGGPIGAAIGAIVGGIIGTGIWFGGAWLVDQMMTADDEAEQSLSPDVAETEVCSTCQPPDEEPSEQEAKDAKRMKDKQLDQAAKNNGYRDAHDLKNDLGLNSKSDIFVDKQGRMYAGPRLGSGTPRYLHMNAEGIY